MMPLDNRAGMLRCFEAFKQFVGLKKNANNYVICGLWNAWRGSSVTNSCNYFSRCGCLILCLDRSLKVVPNFYRSNDCFSQNLYDVPQ